jgi:transposase
MHLIRRLIQLRLQGYSKRSIARHLSLARKTVDKYVQELESHFPDLSVLAQWSDESLYRYLHPQPGENFQLSGALLHPELYASFAEFDKKLAKVGMNRRILWQQYVLNYKGQGTPLAYGQFCHHYLLYCKAMQVSLHLEYKAGEKLFVDFAGQKLTLDIAGSKQELEVFVATLPCSGYCYAQALPSQKLEHFLSALSNAFTFFGGVPLAIVPDNLKSAVTKADRYEPHINESLQEFATHYQTIIDPARVRKPTDKALVEKSIGILYSRVYVPLMEKAAFDSLDSLNHAISLHVQSHNRNLLQGRDYSREDRFLSLEKGALLSLPHRAYHFKHYLQVRVSRNSHVLLAQDKHHYSVPYQYVGKKVKLVVDAGTVEVYHHYSRIAIHKRELLRYGYTTCKEHLPAKHQYLMNWSVEYFLKQAQEIGPKTVAAFTHLLERSSYKGQAYKSCAGILSLTKHYSRERIEAACSRALLFNALTYRHIKAILEKELDKVVESPLAEALSILHENIRGAPAYQ